MKNPTCPIPNKPFRCWNISGVAIANAVKPTKAIIEKTRVHPEQHALTTTSAFSGYGEGEGRSRYLDEYLEHFYLEYYQWSAIWSTILECYLVKTSDDPQTNG